MTNKQSSSDPLDDQTSINKLEAIISDHNKAMRTDMASEITGGSRSYAITNVITVKALIGWHLQKCRSYLPARATEYFDDAGHETFTGWNDCIDEITKRIEEDK